MLTKNLKLALLLAVAIMGGTLVLTGCKKDKKEDAPVTAPVTMVEVEGKWDLQKMSSGLDPKEVTITAPDAVKLWLDPLQLMLKTVIPDQNNQSKTVELLKAAMPVVFDALKGVTVDLQADGTAVFSGVQGVDAQPTGKWVKEGDTQVKLTMGELSVTTVSDPNNEDQKKKNAMALIVQTVFNAKNGGNITLNRKDNTLVFKTSMKNMLIAFPKDYFSAYGTLVDMLLGLMPDSEKTKVSIILVKK